MAKIARKTALIFGSTAGVNQIAEFGSLAASVPAFTTDPAVIQSLSNYLGGWFQAVIGANSPAIEDMNALCFLYAYQIAYIMQAGVAEYDAGTTYYTGSIVNSGGTLFVSQADNNTGNALTDSTKWLPFINRTTIFTQNGIWVCPAGVSRATLVADPNLQVLPQMGMMGFPIDQNGNLWTWGSNLGGVLGSGDATTVVRSSPIMVAGSVKWGRGTIWSNNFPGAIDASGNMWTWSTNIEGMLGTNNSSSSLSVSSPVMVVGNLKIQKAMQLAGSWNALAYDGNLWGWGPNASAIGDGTSTPRSSPVLVAGGFKYVDIGGIASTGVVGALTTGGDIYMWGSNQNGCLGAGISPGVTSSFSSPVLVVGGHKWSKIGVTSQTFDSVNNSSTMAAIDTAGNIWTWGDNRYGQLGIGIPFGTLAAVSSPVMVTAAAKFVDVIQLCVSDAIDPYYPTFYALDTNGNIWSWGSNIKGMLGQNSATGVASASVPTVSSPVMIASTGMKFVELLKNYFPVSGAGAPGQVNMYALAEDGSIWSWGSNAAGNIGNNVSPGSVAAYSSPVMVAGGHVFVAFSSLATQTFGGGIAAMDSQGQVYTWGSNGIGAGAAILGIGVNAAGTAAVSSPTLIAAPGISFAAEQPEFVRSVATIPGHSYPVTVQSFHAVFAGKVIGGLGCNKLSIVY